MGPFPERTLFSAAIKKGKKVRGSGENGELRIKNEEVRREAAVGKISNVKCQR